jgi:hypothetical protein
MTEDRARARAVRPPRPAAIRLGAVALFATFLVLLAWQVRAGRDPALARQAAREAAAHTRPVIVRRVERRIILERVRRIEDDDGASATGAAAAPATAPVPVEAPAAPPAPAPAPAPAPPLTTRSS